MASLWFRRFKPREELDSLKGEILVSDGMLQSLHMPSSDAGGSMHPFGSLLLGASSTKTWENEQLSKIRKLDGKDAALNKSSEGQGYGVETQQNSALLANPFASGKQRNQTADEEKLPMTRCTSEAAMPLHVHVQAAESKSQVLHAVRMQTAEGGIVTSSLGKPPLPPSHNKAGLPPRSAGHKISSFLACSAGKISSSSATNCKLVQETGRHPSHSAVMKKGCQGPLSKENEMCTETGTVLPSTQIAKSVSFSQKTVPSAEFGMQHSVVGHSEGAAGPTRSARDEFVEVYNRARNELKSQKSSSPVAKVFCKEMENCPNVAFGQAICLQDTVIVEHEGQPLDGHWQQEIPGKPRKVEGLDCVAQHEGSKVTANCPQLPQKEPLLEKHNCARFLDGDADISPEKKLQAFQSVHGMSGKESSSFMHGQDGGPPAAMGQKDCDSTFNKSSQCRQAFDGAASIHCKPFQAAPRQQTDCVPHDNMKTLMRFGKRQLGMFNSGTGVMTGKESMHCVTLSRKSEAWLQRWYSPCITSINGSQEHKCVELDVLVQDSAAGNKLMAEESHEHRACVKESFKRRLIEKGVLYQRIMAGEEPECSRASSEKVLPSAAAMAIVGTAAKHFCMVEPQQKGSFSFWSGFGMQTSRTQKHLTEQGKRKLTFEVDPSA